MYESHSFKAARAQRAVLTGLTHPAGTGWNYSLKVEMQFVLFILYKSCSVVKGKNAAAKRFLAEYLPPYRKSPPVDAGGPSLFSRSLRADST